MCSHNQLSKGPVRRCPYATLNLLGTNGGTQVSDDEIRDAYKRLSRQLHPDKRPPGKEREDAQEIFTELMNAYEILSDPVLRQAYDHFGHQAVAQIRHNRYDPSSLYLALSSLHQQGKVSEALETITALLENGAREQRRKEWKFDADVEVNLHVNPPGSDEFLDVTQTSASFTSTVPISQVNTSSQNATESTSARKQQTQLAIGARTYLEKGMGSTRGILTAIYKPSQQTFVSSDLIVGREHLETSLSSVQHMASGTVVSAKVSRQHDFEDGKLSFGFTSSRSLSLIHGRNIHGMFALNFGFDPPTRLKLQYGQLSLTTWGLWADSVNDQEEANDDNDSDAKSHNSANTSAKSTKNGAMKAKAQYEHPPKLTAKLALGQFPLEVAIEQDRLFDSPERKIEASLSYNPFLGTFGMKSLITRALTENTSIAIGVSHIGMQGFTWLFRYERPELTLSVPIFVANFMSANYWNRIVCISICSYLMDETLGEILESEPKKNSDTLDVNERIAVKERHIIKQQQWMHSFDAKISCSQQMMVIEQIAQVKREDEEAKNGLVILSATYEWQPESHDSLHAIACLDVTPALQFWVHNSRLILPDNSKQQLLGLYDLRPPEQQAKRNETVSTLHCMIDCVNNLLACFGIGQTSNKIERLDEVLEGATTSGKIALNIRYKYVDIVYEIALNDDQPVSLPSMDAFKLGAVG